MPTKRQWQKRRGKRKAHRKKIYGTKASFMPRTLALQRYGQVSTRTFYFKASGSINSAPNGNTLFSWNTQFEPAPPPPTGNPFRMPNIADSYIIAECYSEYKVLAIKVKIFAANVGSEVGAIGSTLPPPAPVQVAGFDRGDTVMYLDQEIREGEQPQTNILDVMNLGSCKMLPSRISQYSKVLYRKKGVPEWGCCDRNVPIPNRTPDPWAAAIYLLGNNARIGLGIRPLWFYTVTYKIIFRGRNYTA